MRRCSRAETRPGGSGGGARAGRGGGAEGRRGGGGAGAKRGGGAGGRRGGGAGAGAVSGDRGAASILVLAVGLVLVAAGLAGAAVGTARVARHQARTAADLGALAGAQRAIDGAAPACAAADRFVRANRARMASCRLDGLEIVVHVEVATRPLPGMARHALAGARAGPVYDLGQ